MAISNSYVKLPEGIPLGSLVSLVHLQSLRHFLCLCLSLCVRLDTKPSLRIDGTTLKKKCQIGDGGSCCTTPALKSCGVFHPHTP